MRRMVMFVLAGVTVAALAHAQVPIAVDVLPVFEAASVRPNTGTDLSIVLAPAPPDGIVLNNYPLDSVIRYAYGLQPFRVLGMPEWARNERFDIRAKASAAIDDRQRALMVRALLRDRFGLKTSLETRDQTVYVMRAVRADKSIGPGLQPRPDCAKTPCRPAGTTNRGGGMITIRGTTLAQFANGPLSLVLDQVVRDESGIEGTFDAQLSWRPDTASAAQGDSADGRASLFTAVQEQLGVRLTPERRPVEVLVIESLSRPTPD